MKNSSKSKLDWAIEFFSNDTFSVRQLGAKIEAAEDGYARCSLEPDERHQNAAGSVMGGVIFSLADFAFAVAANSKSARVVTQSASTVFLSSPKCSRMIAEASCIKRGRNLCCYDITVSDDVGTPVAKVVISGFITDLSERH